MNSEPTKPYIKLFQFELYLLSIRMENGNIVNQGKSKNMVIESTLDSLSHRRAVTTLAEWSYSQLSSIVTREHPLLIKRNSSTTKPIAPSRVTSEQLILRFNTDVNLPQTFLVCATCCSLRNWSGKKKWMLQREWKLLLLWSTVAVKLLMGCCSRLCWTTKRLHLYARNCYSGS